MCDKITTDCGRVRGHVGFGGVMSRREKLFLPSPVSHTQSGVTLLEVSRQTLGSVDRCVTAYDFFVLL